MLAPLIDDRATVCIFRLQVLAIHLIERLSRFWAIDSNGLFFDRVRTRIELLSVCVRECDLSIGVESICPCFRA